MPCAFCHDDDVVFLVCHDVVVQACDEFGDTEGQFRGQNNVGASCQSGFECNGAIVSSHDLDDEYTVVRLRHVANTVDGVNGDVDSSVKPDGVVKPIQVVVDGRRDSNDGNAQLAAQVTTSLCAVSPDPDHAVQPVLLDDERCLLTAFLSAEQLTAGTLEHCASEFQDAGDTACVEFYPGVGYQSVVAALEPDRLDSHRRSRACNCADGSVHTAGIAAARQKSDAFHGYLEKTFRRSTHS